MLPVAIFINTFSGCLYGWALFTVVFVICYCFSHFSISFHCFVNVAFFIGLFACVCGMYVFILNYVVISCDWLLLLILFSVLCQVYWLLHTYIFLSISPCLMVYIRYGKPVDCFCLFFSSISMVTCIDWVCSVFCMNSSMFLSFVENASIMKYSLTGLWWYDCVEDSFNRELLFL